MARAAARHQAHFALDRRVGTDDKVGIIVHGYQPGVGVGQSLQGFMHDIGWLVDEFFHMSQRAKWDAARHVPGRIPFSPTFARTIGLVAAQAVASIPCGSNTYFLAAPLSKS